MSKELLNIQMDVKDNQDKQESNGYKVYDVENTPFSIVEKEDGETMLTIGNAVVINNIENTKETLDEIYKVNWQLVLTTCAIYIDKLNELKTERK